ncbi:biofilm regulation diguanylate cyclase SiaD [Synechococcus sp. BA-132 BA5]|uniref:biofilm regulation diguanylate cyclase SiaD n=1 Tax=Synechococcus sp. BA-132 BA5 TaxID=3110252 RepID=UPI002B21C336|nr:biofilm regulation diguanylate cyclase SiaD [Synechococcus sp. BA-132 BA5]MEA5416584.1 biofilm regulation diguanylate cyclase SiaD [Synechococcus sp. BA-132 BA5]
MTDPYSPTSDIQLEQEVMAILADHRYDNDPIRDLLGRLWNRVEEQVNRLERVADISDLYQSHVLESNRSLTSRYEKQLRQIKRVVKISDLYQASLKELNLSLFEASTHDSLTGISNRRFMAERCLEEDQRALRHGSTYSIIILDVDHFKLINDEYGHATGDLMLVDFVKALSRSVRHYDIIARWGGEEFMALLIDADLLTAEIIAKRMLANIRSMRVSIDDMDLNLTASMGLTEHQPDENYDATFRRADKALLLAKNGGRDRLVVIDPTDHLSHREISTLVSATE